MGQEGDKEREREERGEKMLGEEKEVEKIKERGSTVRNYQEKELKGKGEEKKRGNQEKGGQERPGMARERNAREREERDCNREARGG